MENEQATAPAATRDDAHPALSISKPPPRRERVMTYVLCLLFAGALALGFGGMVAHWMRGS